MTLIRSWLEMRREKSATVAVIACPETTHNDETVAIRRPWHQWLEMAAAIEKAYQVGTRPPLTPYRRSIWPVLASRTHRTLIYPYFPSSDQDRQLVESGLAYLVVGAYRHVVDGDMFYVHLHDDGDVAISHGHEVSRLPDKPVRVYLGNYKKLLEIIGPIR